MKDEKKTKRQLLSELVELRQRIAELEAREAEHKRTEEKAQRRLARLQALWEIDRAISSSLELKDILEVLLDKLTKLPHVDGASVMVLEPDTKELKTVAIRNLSEEFARTAETRLSDGLPHLVVEGQKPLVVTDLMTNERVVHRDLLRREELASYIGLPLLARGELIGVLGIYSRERHRWSEEQTDFLHTLAGQAAIAVHNAELYDQVLNRVQTIQAMREIDRTVLSGLTLKEVSEAIAATIGRLIPYNRASIAILEDGTFAIVASLANGQVAIPKEVKISAAETFLSEVVAGRHPAYRPDISSRERLYRYDKQLLEEGITSDLIIPLIARGKVLGTLNLGRYQPNGFDPKAIALAEELARQLAIAIDNALAYQRLKELNLQTIAALSTAMGAKDPYTEDHSAQVTRLAVAIAERMGLPEEEIENLRVAGLLHDIGKIGIPDSVLNKPARLTRAEFTMIEAHPIAAAEIVERIGPLSGSVPAIRHHHERYDGQGYPDGLQGEEIPLLARIMAMADGFNAMTSERPYRRALTEEEALAELEKGAGTQWDPQVVEVFVKTYEGGIVS